MDVTCPRCQARHHVDPPASARARTRPLRFRCSECGHTFPVHSEAGAALPPAMLPIEPPSRFAVSPRAVSPGEAVEMVRVAGDVYSVPDLATLQRWILEGRVGRKDSVSQHGMRWTPVGERPDLAPFCTAADRLDQNPTIAPGPSPLAPDRASLPMAPNEEIYVREDAETGPSPTSFVGERPEADEVPPISDVIPNEPTSETLAADEAGPSFDVPAPVPEASGQRLMAAATIVPEASPPPQVWSGTLEPEPSVVASARSLGSPPSGEAGGLPLVRSRTLEPEPFLPPHPVKDDPTIEAREVASARSEGPVDELPVGLVARRPTPTTLPEAPPGPPAPLPDARQLGFQLGPDPDTQEATIEATHQSAPPSTPLPTPPAVPSTRSTFGTDAFDSFMTTGKMPEVTPSRDSFSSLPGVRPPPISIDGRVPTTVAPHSGRSRSVLDDDPPSVRPGSNTAMWAAMAVGAVMVVGFAGLALRVVLGPDADGAGSEAASGTAAGPTGIDAPPATLAEAEAKARAEAAAHAAIDPAAEQAAADRAAADKAAADKAAADKAAADKAAADKAAAAKAAADKAAADKAAAKAAADKAAADKAAAAKAGAGTTGTGSTGSGVVKPKGTSAKALADAGWKAMDKGNVEEAHGFFSRALQVDGRSGWALYGRGYCNEKLGDRVSARADYCQALAGGPSDGELVRELNGSLRRLGESCGG